MSERPWDAVWTNARLATMAEGGVPYGAVEDGALAVRDGILAWVGPAAALPADGRSPETVTHDAGGRWITPGLIDCHTHIIHAGDRAGEFAQRLGGASYEEIARAGGGIRATVAATRAASEEALYAAALPLLRALMAEGVTTIEIKSGYGLDGDSECKMLRVARRIGERLPLTVHATFLGAHALPPEYEGRADDYIALVCEDMLPRAAREGLVDAVDAFCEGIGFSVAQTRRVFTAARALSLPVKLHAEQLSDLKGAVLAAEFGALSADHLEYVGADGVAAMAAAGTVAVLPPGAFYVLGETRRPPVALFREHGVAMALATDCNPGSSPISSLLLMLNMGCTLFRLTPEEALAGVTRNAARALGQQARLGTLAPGKAADFVLWDIDDPAALSYRIGLNPVHRVIRAGRVVTG